MGRARVKQLIGSVVPASYGFGEDPNDSQLSGPPTATKQYYTFDGWDPAVSEKVEGDQTYTAKWKKNATPNVTPSKKSSGGTTPPAPKPAQKNNVVKTGDVVNLMPLLAVLVASAATMFVAGSRRRKLKSIGKHVRS